MARGPPQCTLCLGLFRLESARSQWDPLTIFVQLVVMMICA